MPDLTGSLDSNLDCLRFGFCANNVFFAESFVGWSDVLAQPSDMSSSSEGDKTFCCLVSLEGVEPGVRFQRDLAEVGVLGELGGGELAEGLTAEETEELSMVAGGAVAIGEIAGASASSRGGDWVGG